MKYLFVVPPFFGHISPTLSVGAGLIGKGHEVAWVGLKEIPEKHIPPGGRFIVPQEELAPHAEEIEHILKIQDQGTRLSAVETLKLVFEDTFLPFCRFMLKGLDRIVDHFQPDVIVHDCVAYAGAICAWRRGIPYVTTTPVPPNLGMISGGAPKILEWQMNHFTSLQQEFGIYTDELVIQSDKMNLVFTSREFAGIEDPPEQMKFVGPVKGRPEDTPFDWDRLARASSPKIYISLGTLLVDIRKEFFRKLTEAFASEPLTIVAATDPGILDDWPDNFIVQSYVPQSRLMQQIDAVICHGGFNTVNETFLNGLPLLITPIAYDHFHTAALVEQAGCGIRLRYKRMRMHNLKAAMRELLENPTYRKASERIQETFLKAGGLDQAVSYLTAFAQEAKKLHA